MNNFSTNISEKLLKFSIHPSHSIKQAVKVIDNGAAQVGLVINSDAKLLGIVTDGDVRRAILNGISMDELISSIMTTSPICLEENSSKVDALNLMRQNGIQHIPVVNDQGILVDLFVLDELLQPPLFPNPIVLMAGGRGQRLQPLTDNCPKPMLAIDNKPILEIILSRCVNAGFKNFYISVNYLKEQIFDFFGDGTKWGVRINYLEEKEPLGTCGSLNLLPSNITEDIIVMNGDIITELYIDKLIRFHQKSKNLMTVCSRSHKVRIPFAVLNTINGCLNNFTEKPLYDYQVNAGVYVLNPKCLKEIPQKFFNMTNLMDKLLINNKKLGVFPIHESWTDIGNKSDFFSFVKQN